MSPQLHLFILYAAIVACVLLIVLMVYVLFKYLSNLNRQKKKNLQIKQEKFDSFKSVGFRSTSQYKIENQFLAIDENSKRWFLMDMYNPSTCVLHTFSEIKSITVNKEAHRVGSSHRGRIMKGYYVSNYESHSETTKLLLVIGLNNLKRPTETINFIRRQNLIDDVKHAFVTMKENA